MNRLTSAPARAAALAIAGVLAYLPALGAGFVFDDEPLILRSEVIRGPLARIWFTTAAPDYLPATWTMFWLEWRLWGEHAAGYHAVNLALHLCVAVLLWRALTALRIPGAWLAGVLFAVHPVTVESAAWISEGKNTLSAVFFVAAVLAWIRAESADDRRYRVATAGLFLAALLSKSSVVMLPFVLLAISVLRRGRLDRATVARTAPLFAMSAAAMVLTIVVQRENAMAGIPLPPRGLGERVGGAGWALASYLRHATIPARLAFTYPPWPVEAGSPWFYVPLAAHVAAAAALWRWRHRWTRPLLLALGYHAVLLLPILGLVDYAFLRIAPVSNHLHYLALIGPVALAAWVLARAHQRFPRAARVAAAAIVVSSAAATARRASAFSDDLTLWQEAVRAAPENAFAREQLAACLLERGDRAGAVRELAGMVEVSRDPGTRQWARTLLAVNSGRLDEAAAEAVAGVAIEPARPWGALARDLVRGGHAGQAVPVLEAVVARAPAAPAERYWLAVALSRQGRTAEAIAHLREALRLAPRDARYEEALAMSLARAGDLEEARQHLAAARGTAPNDPTIEKTIAQWRSALPSAEAGRSVNP